MAHIEFVDVSFTYQGNPAPAVKHIDFHIQKGQWVVICGPSGSGKSTLLKVMKPECLPNGKLQGEIILDGKPLQSLSHRESAQHVALLTQYAEQQMVMDRVIDELVFSMENLGISSSVIRKRLAEMTQWIDIQSILDHHTMKLSGGQQQQIALASVLMLQPHLLLLDEPLAQLDPLASQQMISVLRTLHEEYGMTILMTTHRLEDVWHVADEIWFMEQGSLDTQGMKRPQVSQRIEALQPYLPSTTRLMLDLGIEQATSLTHHAMRAQLDRYSWAKELDSSDTSNESRRSHPPLLAVKDIRFRYPEQNKWVCNHLSLRIQQGDLLAVCGANGSGKSTLLQILASRLKVQDGKLTRIAQGTIGYVAQQPQLHFLEESVEQQLRMTLSRIQHTGIAMDWQQIAEQYDLNHLLSKHPHDLSGGEQQRLSLACAMMARPQLLLLDEPTKGLDPIHKQKIKTYLDMYHAQGTTIVFATHDLEFVAELANRCVMLFEGEIVADDTPVNFFTDNVFYTTAIHRLVRPWLPDAIHREEVLAACRGKQ